MTKKDFKLIAGVLYQAQAPDECVYAMARALATTNPGFDRNRFVAASICGNEKDVPK